MSIKNVEPGDFQRVFTDIFSSKIEDGEPITQELVRSCCAKVREELDVVSMPSDELRISDLFDLLEKNKDEIIRLNSDALRKKIFGLIFEK